MKNENCSIAMLHYKWKYSVFFVVVILIHFTYYFMSFYCPLGTRQGNMIRKRQRLDSCFHLHWSELSDQNLLLSMLLMKTVHIFYLFSWKPLGNVQTFGWFKGFNFLAHLSWKLKWAFLITCRPASVCPSVCL